MSLVRTYYRVSIVDTGFSTTPPAEGFIDNKKVWEEAAFQPEGTPGTNVPTNKAAGLLKARGAYRWHLLQNHMSDGVVTFFFGYVATPGTPGTIDTEPDRIDFTVGYQKPAAEIQTHDELNAGEILTGSDAVKRLAARCFCYDYDTNLQYYDPTESGGRDAGIVMANLAVEAPAIGANLTDKIADAEANITVTLIDNVG